MGACISTSDIQNTLQDLTKSNTNLKLSNYKIERKLSLLEDRIFFIERKINQIEQNKSRNSKRC